MNPHHTLLMNRGSRLLLTSALKPPIFESCRGGTAITRADAASRWKRHRPFGTRILILNGRWRLFTATRTELFREPDGPGLRPRCQPMLQPGAQKTSGRRITW
jgi:hypothetical protein